MKLIYSHLHIQCFTHGATSSASHAAMIRVIMLIVTQHGEESLQYEELRQQQLSSYQLLALASRGHGTGPYLQA